MRCICSTLGSTGVEFQDPDTPSTPATIDWWQLDQQFGLSGRDHFAEGVELAVDVIVG